MSTNSEAGAHGNDGEDVEVAVQRERPGTPDIDQCSICLDEISDSCRPDMCRHSFCYACLTRWSTVESFCPLCKTKFKSIRHSFTEDGLYRVYDVPVRPSGLRDPFLEITTRGVVYHQHMWAEPLSDSNGGFRGVNSRFFRDNPEQTNRMRVFIHREVSVLIVLQRNETDALSALNRNIDFLTNFIISLISVFEIMDGEIAETLRPYIGGYAPHLCHELYNFANCPYDTVIDYNLNVSYTGGIIDLPLSEQIAVLYQVRMMTRILMYIETLGPDSDDDEDYIETGARRTPPEVIEVDSSSDDSDVEVNDIISRPIETRESPSVGQPSTSSGIRYSVNRPNNETTRRLSRRGTGYVNRSSSDEEFTSDVQSACRMVCRKRKRQIETIKNRRTKRSNGEQQTAVGRHSYSESSSSDDEDV